MNKLKSHSGFQKLINVEVIRPNTFNHYALFTSPNRNNWFYNQIKKVCLNKVCLDIGTGSGILSLFAIQAGAKHVYMVDHNLGVDDRLTRED